MPIKTTQEKFIHELGDILDAENRFLKGQQEMLEQATDETLKSGLQTHIIEGAQLMGQDRVVTPMQQNLQQEEKTAQLLESNAPKLLQKAMQSEQ